MRKNKFVLNNSLLTNFDLLVKTYDKYQIAENQLKLIQRFFKCFKKEESTEKEQDTLLKLIYNDIIFIDNEIVIEFEKILSIFKEKEEFVCYELGEVLLLESCKDSILKTAEYASIFSKINYSRFFRNIFSGLNNNEYKILWILSNLDNFKDRTIKNYLNKIEKVYFYRLPDWYYALVIVSFIENFEKKKDSLLYWIISFLDKRGYPIYKESVLSSYIDNGDEDLDLISFKKSLIDIFLDNNLGYNCKFFNYFFKKANKKEKSLLISRNLYKLPLSLLKKNEESIKILEESIEAFARDIVDEVDYLNSSNIKKLLFLFKSKYKFRKKRVFFYIIAQNRIEDFILYFIKNVDFRLRLSRFDKLDLFNFISEEFLLEKDDDKWLEIYKILYSKYSLNLHFIELLNDIYLRNMEIFSFFRKKVNKLYLTWEELSKKYSMINTKSFDRKKFFPIIDDDFLKKICSFNSRDDAVLMITNNKKLKYELRSIINKMDIYKYWIVYNCVKANLNYDLIINFIKEDIEYIEDDLIHVDLSKVLLFLKDNYGEKRIFSMLKKKINLEHLEDYEIIVDTFKKEGVLSDILPKKPKTIDEIFINLNLSLSYMKDDNVTLKQKNLYSLNNMKINDNHEIKVPKKHYDLVKAGAILGQCVGDGNYTMEINEGKAGIILVYKEEKLKYCVELTDTYRIRSSGGYKNNKIPFKVLSDLKKKISELKNQGLL